MNAPMSETKGVDLKDYHTCKDCQKHMIWKDKLCWNCHPRDGSLEEETEYPEVERRINLFVDIGHLILNIASMLLLYSSLVYAIVNNMGQFVIIFLAVLSLGWIGVLREDSERFENEPQVEESNGAN